MSYPCACCGETHDGLPDVGFDRPACAADIPEAERPARVRLTSDLCAVDDEHFFVRGVIEVPVVGQGAPFGIGAWVSQRRENFEAYEAHGDSAGIGPFFGWLSNEFAFGGEPTLNIRTMAHFRGGPIRPRIDLEPSDHPLAVAQRVGLSLDDAWAFVHRYLDA